jgi:hypothetical protein
LYEQLKHTLKHDMDFVVCSKFRSFTKQPPIDSGRELCISMRLTGATGRHRQGFNDEHGNEAIDVLMKELRMRHVVDIKED